MKKTSLLQIILKQMRPPHVVRPSHYWNHIIWSHIKFPELLASKNVYQKNNQSVWFHTMDVIDHLFDSTDIALLAGLFHDLGKCGIPEISDPSLPRFPGHAVASANIAEDTLVAWGGSNHLIDRVSKIVSTHMYDISNAAREKTIRKFVADVGQDNITNWFDVRIADSMSYTKRGQYYSKYIQPFKLAVETYLASQPGFEVVRLSDSVGGIQIEGRDAS